MNQKSTKRNIDSFLLYVFSFLLLWEWLRPVEQLTGTSSINIFLGFIFGSLLLAFLGLPLVPAVVLKLIYILLTIQYIYFGNVDTWIDLFLKDFFQNAGSILKGQWTEMSDSFRTLLFFALLWITTYLLRYWLIDRKNILFFFLATLIFITVLDAFSPYEADAAIIRSVLTGFAMMGILTFRRLADSENIQKNSRIKRKWMFSLAAVIAGSAVIAFAVPKADPVWPNPVPFLKSLSGSGNTAVNETKRSGLRSDDSELGGPFLPANMVVFTAEVEEPHYWKVDTRDVYTGKGWISSSRDGQPLNFRRNVPSSLFSFTEKVPSEERTSIVYNEEDHAHIQYPHGLQRIDATSSYRYQLNQQTNGITALNGAEQEAPASYSVQYEHPSFQAKDLEASSPEEADRSFQAIADTYTQLPENVPPEIRELALDITRGQETWFDKAKAVEAYFSSSGFAYEQVDVPVPSEDEDYVAQFLFDTKRGYCDNFSTSMAVLLRTLDIPTRWVKGYTEGTYLETNEAENKIYQVTSENAHSWVEVYFPNIGWVPFEPTQGFTNEDVPELEETTETLVEEETTENIETPVETPEQPVAAEPEPEEEVNDASQEAPQPNVGLFLKTNWKNIVVLVAAVFVMASLSYRSRRKWLPFYYIFIYKRDRQDHHFPKAYLVLLTQLERCGLKRKAGQTLREYAKEIDLLFSSSSMTQLTGWYEQYLYRGSLPKGTWENARNEWESLMKKTR